MVSVLHELMSCGLELSAEELGGAPAVKDVSHRDKQGTGYVMEKSGEGLCERVLVGLEEDSEVR